MNSRKTSYILAVENDRVIIRNYDDYFSPRVITSVSDFSEFLFLEAARHGVSPDDDLRVFVSSSMDFPEDETCNPETIALAKALRGRKP